jgi:site-specific recombinase XerD
MNSRITFNSFLTAYFEDYLSYRKDVGYTCGNLRWFFSTFDRFVCGHDYGWRDLNPARLLEFRDTIEAEPVTVNKIFILLRGFFDYLVRMELLETNPASDIPPIRENAYIPYVFTPEEIEKLLKAVEKNIRKRHEYDFLKHLSVYTAIMLMAR